ncbi:PREDICTED: probable LRR receptor-like serine/threonine-protein kinase At4g37250 [Nelumbo nucifera]|uniref:Probable LRR receptor-like serine/threonine-protein kinase At4g37250 n=1 Tax=Nelumbo nucifera TaxID=4432 RepID=A0A1U7YXM1_NELNU|nr:PREDICTED: probable LRR receptor-like serine/threonine-protein kinase At4g37250 [Nelumbo nucifera]
MSCRSSGLHFLWRVWRLTPLVFLLLAFQSLGLNTDGILLLSFKYSVLSDPLSVLESWNYEDQTPCSWNGITCAGFGIPGTGDTFRVTRLHLPDSQLLGSIPPDLGMLEHLQHLDLSNNFLNGSLPTTLFNSSELRILSLSNNVISGALPESIGGLKSLEFLNLSDNALAGKIPQNLTALQNLTVAYLSNNYFSGDVPSGFKTIQVLDLSSNLINGSLPPDFGGNNIRYLNLSYNRLFGRIPLEFAKQIPGNVTLDLSFNNLTGEVPQAVPFLNQRKESFAGNLDLCGRPLKNPCAIPSMPSTPPNVSTTTSPPAFAAIPKTIEPAPVTGSPGAANDTSQKQGQNSLRPGTIASIIFGDLAGIGILAMIFLYIYHLRKRKKKVVSSTGSSEKKDETGGKESWPSSSFSTEPKGLAWSCLGKKGGNSEETSEATGSDSEEDEEEKVEQEQQDQQKGGGSLVTVDGETELELETLLKASAYILGATSSSIVYKAVLEDGTTLAVRRIGESGVERFKDFENQVRLIAKLRHPNLVRIRGFYWGSDEKLVIYDYVPNGSLANASYKKMGSSPCRHLPWEVRLNIAKGVARGLAYLHDKKHVHGNLKPSNILLGADMEPRIGDFGLERLVWGGDSSYKSNNGSFRHFGSKRSTVSRDSFQDLPTGASPSLCGSPYQAPEALKSLKPNSKWDVFSYGVVLLELLTGKVHSDMDLGLWNTAAVDEKNRILRMADVAIRAELESKEKEEAFATCFKLGYGCASALPQKRPSMKEVAQILDKMPSSPHYYNH